jgi:hypothetical protein
MRAQAFSSEAWRCTGSTEMDSAELSKLNLDKNIYSLKSGELTLNQATYCDVVHELFYNDAFEFEGHYLMIGVGQTSRLKTRTGKKIILFCN